MSRSFRDLVEALKAKEEKSELKPRAKGEEDFASSQGYPPKIGGPDDRPYPEKGSDDVVNARKATKTKMHDNPVPGNETGKQPMQGSSQSPQLKTYRDVIAGLKQTDGGRGYQLDNGDLKIVRNSPTSVKGTDVNEGNDSEPVNHMQSGKRIGTISKVPGGYKVVSKDKNREFEGAHKVDLVRRLHDYADRLDEEFDLSENITIGRAKHAGGGVHHHDLYNKDGRKLGTLAVDPDDTQTLITSHDPGVPHSQEMWGNEVDLKGRDRVHADHLTSGIPEDHPIHHMLKGGGRLGEAIDPFTMGAVAGAAGTMYLGHKLKQAGQELRAGEQAHKDLVHSMIDRSVDSHEVIGHNKHRITYKNGNVSTIHTSSHGTTRIKTKTNQGKSLPSSTVKHNLRKLVKAGVGQKQVDESVQDQLAYIAETSKTAMVTFNNGETATVNPQTAHKMLETASRLNATNARRFNESINESSDGFLKMMQFSEKH